MLGNISTGSVLGPGFSGGQAGHMAGLAEARRANVPWRRAAAGDTWTIDGVDFQVLSPAPADAGERANVAPTGLRVAFGRCSAGDADAEIEAGLMDRLDGSSRSPRQPHLPRVLSPAPANPDPAVLHARRMTGADGTVPPGRRDSGM